MVDANHSRAQTGALPLVLPVRQRAQVVYQVLRERVGKTRFIAVR